MTSQIDASVFPDNVKVHKHDLRDQFTIAHNEITALQNAVVDVGAGIFISPGLFGASVTKDDNVAELTAWLNHLIANDVVGYWPATYKIKTGITITAPGGTLSIICGPAAGLDMSGGASSMTALSINGTVSSAVPLTSVVARSVLTLNCTAGAELLFTAGSLLKLASDDLFDPARSNSWKGEMIYVASVAPGVITLRTSTRDFYDTNVNVYLITPVRVLIAGGLKITGTRNAAHAQLGFICNYVVNSQLSDITTDGVSSLNVSMQNAMDCYIYRPTCTDALNATTGYAISFSNACRECHVVDGYIRRVRHAFTTGSTLSQLGGVVRDVTITRLTGENTFADCFDTHGNFDNLTYIDCVSLDSASAGFNTEGGSVSIIRPRVYRSVSTGINCTAGSNAVKTNVYIENAYVEEAGGVGISCSTAVFIAPDPEPLGLATVQIIAPHVVRSAQMGLRIERSSAYTTNPEVVKVIGGTLDGCGTTLCMQLSYVNNFLVSGVTLLNVPVAATAFLCNVCSNGAIRDVTGAFQNAATLTMLSLTTCTNVSFSGIKVVAPGQVSLRGVTLTSPVGIRSLGDNDFSQTTTPFTVANTAVVAGVVTLPHAIAGLALRIGDGVTPVSIDTINGGRRGDVITVCGVNSTGPATFKHGTGNILLRDGRDVFCDSANDVLMLSYDDATVAGWREIVTTDTQGDVFTVTVSTTVSLEHDRKVLAVNAAAGTTVTLPNSHQVGFRMKVVQRGAGQVTFSPAAGALLRNFSTHTKTAGQFAAVELTVIANTGGAAAEWYLSGNTAA